VGVDVDEVLVQEASRARSRRLKGKKRESKKFVL
jgi:hypothetical protein